MFLDDDMLCSMQKRFGHEYLPRTCQAFPFAFTREACLYEEQDNPGLVPVH